MRTVFSVLPFVFAAMLVPLYSRPAGLRVRTQALCAALFLLCASKFAVFQALGGDSFAPELPEPVIWAWGWAYSGMCILLAFAVAGRLALRIFRAGPLEGRKKAAWLVLLPAAAWIASAVGVWNGIRPPEIAKTEIAFANLPPDLDGYRIILVTDIHAGSSAKAWRTRKIVETVNAADADLVCLAGDYADGMPEYQAANLEPIRDLAAKDGVLAVSGNHEYYFDPLGWRRRFVSWCGGLLENECAFPRKSLAVAGVRDPVCAQFGFEPPDPDAAFANATNGEFRILLQHRPDVDYKKLFGREPSAKVDLQLSGHTHGGIAPVFQWLIGRLNGGMSRGEYDRPDGRKVFVSPGAGQWGGFPVRFFNPCRIDEITLRRKE